MIRSTMLGAFAIGMTLAGGAAYAECNPMHTAQAGDSAPMILAQATGTSSSTGTGSTGTTGSGTTGSGTMGSGTTGSDTTGGSTMGSGTTGGGTTGSGSMGSGTMGGGTMGTGSAGDDATRRSAPPTDRATGTSGGNATTTQPGVEKSTK